MAEVSSVVVKKALLDASALMEVIGRVTPSNEAPKHKYYAKEEEDTSLI